MHTLKISVLDPATVPGGYSFARVKEELGRRMHLLPPFRRRLVDVPVRPPPPAVDRGSRLRSRLAHPPGGRAGARGPARVLRADLRRRQPPARPAPPAVGDLGRRGPRRRPGRLRRPSCTTAWPTAWRPPRCWPTCWRPSPTRSSPGRPIARGCPIRSRDAGGSCSARWSTWCARSLGLPALLGRTIAGHAQGRRGCARPTPTCPSATPLNTPKTRFNGSLTPHRIFATTTVSLDEVKAVRQGLRRDASTTWCSACAPAPWSATSTSTASTRTSRSWPACRSRPRARPTRRGWRATACPTCSCPSGPTSTIRSPGSTPSTTAPSWPRRCSGPWARTCSPTGAS